jgi:hypothetical protein
MMKTKSNPLRMLLLVAAVVGLAAPPLAYAVPTLRLTYGANTVEIADASGSDSNPLAGAVTFIGPLGNFFLNVSTGISKPVLGSATLPSMDLSSVDVSGPSGGTLTILFSDDFFGPTFGGVTASIGGTTGGTVLYSTYADASNVLFGMSTLLTTQGAFTGPAFSGTTFADLGLPSFSLTQEVVISHGSAGATSFNAELKAAPKAVPDGGSTAALLGAVLVGLESLRRRFRVS